MENDSHNYWASAEEYLQIEGDASKFNVLHPELLRVAGDIRGKKALDFGCGDGSFSVKLADAGAEVLGVDTSMPSVQRARKLYPNRKLRFEHIIPSDSNLIAQASPFDIIILCLVLNTMPDYQSASDMLKFISQFSVSGGQLLIAITHPLTRNKSFSTYCCGLSPEQYRIDGSPFSVELSDGYFPDKKTRFTDYHYSLSATTAFIHEGGFLIRRLYEVYDSVDIEKLHPDVRGRLNKNDPAFLIIDALKV